MTLAPTQHSRTPQRPFSGSRLRALGAGIGLSTLLALTACGGAGAQSPAADGGGDPVSGGTLRFAVGSDAGCIDPQQVGSNDSIYSTRQLVDSLTDQDPETGEIVPWLAQEWEINDDATEFTFTLQEGVTFSDGTPVDSEAVAANFDRALDLGARAALIGGYLQGYEGTEIVDERTFTVTFAEPSAQFLQATSTHTLGILHPDTVAASDDARCESVIGSGPFVLESYTPNDSISLSAREGYDWGSSLWENQSEPYLDGIEFTVVPESGVRAGSLQSDQVDVIGNIAPQDEAQLQAAEAQLLARTNPGIAFGLRLNHDLEVFADEEVREAISLAINREEIVSTVYTADTPAATSILSSTTPDHADLSEHLGHDPQRAEQLIAEAGYERTDDGGWERDGEPLEFEILWFNNAATNAPTLELIQQQLAAVGIGVSLQEGQVAEWQTHLSEGTFETNWGNITRADPDILRTTYHTDLANSYRLEPSALDDLLLEQAAATDPQERAELVAQAQEHLVTEYLEIPVVDLTTVLAVRAEVHGVRFDSGSRVHLNDVWIEDAEQ